MITLKHKSKFSLALVSAICLSSLAIAVFRALLTGLTYDEAFTYVEYVQKLSSKTFLDIFNNSLANNHWLNTILIRLIQGVTKELYNEFLIRLPSLCFYVIYLAMTIFIYIKKCIPFWAFALLNFSFYLNEFFGLARGYGMATSILLVAFYYYYSWYQDTADKFSYLTLFFTFMALSTTALTLTFLVFFAFSVVVFILLLKKRLLFIYLKKQWFFLLPISAMSLIMLKYHFNSTTNGKPLPSTSGTFFESFFEGFVSLYTQNGVVISIFAYALCVGFLISLVLFFKKIGESAFVLPLIIYLSLWFFIKQMTSLTYPNQRCILFTLPFFVLAIVEIVGWYKQFFASRFIAANCKYIYLIVILLLTILLTTLFFSNVHLRSTKEWRGGYPVRKLSYQTLIDKTAGNEQISNVTTYSKVFYQQKILYFYQYDILQKE